MVYDIGEQWRMKVHTVWKIIRNNIVHSSIESF